MLVQLLAVSDLKSTKRGVPQGGTMSPKVFTTGLEDVIIIIIDWDRIGIPIIVSTCHTYDLLKESSYSRRTLATFTSTSSRKRFRTPWVFSFL